VLRLPHTPPRRAQYRLCPAGDALTEACFKQTPLAFKRDKQALQWKNGTRWPIQGTFVDAGTLPAGSTWWPREGRTSSPQPGGLTACASLLTGR
jgi:hypothetical protein